MEFQTSPGTRVWLITRLPNFRRSLIIKIKQLQAIINNEYFNYRNYFIII